MLALAALAGGPAVAEETPVYDAALAAELGADEYGMRSYVFVVLRTGPNEIADEAKRTAAFRGHFANMKRLAEKGDLLLAGPLGDEGDKRGIFIFNTDSIDAAKAMLADDPTVASGVFVAEYSGLYGSAALIKLNDIHKRVQKKAIE